MGTLPHIVISAFYELRPIGEVTDQELKLIQEFLPIGGNNYSVISSSFTDNKDKNLIIIIVESLNSWVLDIESNGRHITPNLKSLMASGNAIIATDLMSQAGPGRSSDGQLIINTGLFPLRGEATMTRHSANHVPSLAKAMCERPKFEVICEEKALWRHGITSLCEGYDAIYDAADAKAAGLKTKPFEETMFKLAEMKISKAKQPFFCTLITLAMHGPYSGEPKWKSWISEASFPHDLTTYLESTFYFDQELGKFIDFLKVNGIYENSIIVITSDHESQVPGYDGVGIGTVPFIVLNTGLDTVITRHGGQIDIYPTILEITGHTDYEWKGFGTSLLVPTPDGAMSPNGIVHGHLSASELSQYKNAWDASELIIKHNYLKDKLKK